MTATPNFHLLLANLSDNGNLDWVGVVSVWRDFTVREHLLDSVPVEMGWRGVSVRCEGYSTESIQNFLIADIQFLVFGRKQNYLHCRPELLVPAVSVEALSLINVQ